MSQVVDTVLNPANTAQRYSLWANGRIDAAPGTPPAVGGPNWQEYGVSVGVAIYVTDWAAGAGYVLSRGGGFHAFGGAPAVGVGNIPESQPGVPLVDPKTNALYIDWSWDPNGTGQGYVLSRYGEWFHFGGATPCPRAGPLFTEPLIRRGFRQWSPFPRSVMLGAYGGLHQDWPYRVLGSGEYFEADLDWARDLIVSDWGNASNTATPNGWKLTADGKVSLWGPNAPDRAVGYPYAPNTDRYVTLDLVRPYDPTQFIVVAKLGSPYPWTASTPPRVIAGGHTGSPAAVVVDTTRPKLTWSYTDAQDNAQIEWRVLVFTQSWVNTHDMSLPLKWSRSAVFDATGRYPETRGVTPTVDLVNGGYTFYVRAKDSSELWSLWDSLGWTQNVARPRPPTSLAAAVDNYHVNLTATIPGGTVGEIKSVLFEFSDDAGLTWRAVRGAEAVPLLAVTEATDWDIPLDAPRIYRAITFGLSPRVSSDPSPEDTVTLRQSVDGEGDYLLTSTADPELGGRFAFYGLTWSRPRTAGLFDAIGSDYPTVVSDGRVKGRRGTASIRTLDRDTYRRLAAVLGSDATLLVRDQFGEAIYCRPIDDWSETLLAAAPLPEETTGLRHAHEHEVRLVEVRRPLPVPAEDE